MPRVDEALQGRPLRVLHVTAVEHDNYYLNNLADHMPSPVIRLTFATLGFDRGFVEGLRRRNVDAHAMGAPGRSRLPTAAVRLARLIRSARPQLLHSHEFDTTLLAVLLGALLSCRVVRTRHYSDAIQRLENGAKRRFYSRVEKWMNARVSRVIVPAQRVRDTVVGLERVDPAKVRLIPYGQTRARFDAVTPEHVARARGTLSPQGRRPLLVYVARLHPEKGHRYLLEALAQLRSEGFDGTLCLVGTGPAEGVLRSLAHRLGIEDVVKFLGWRDDALAIIAAADLVVHPSLHEALSSAVIEAVALGRPIVAADVSGVRDVLGDSECGLVVPPGDTRALLEGIRQSLASLPAWRERARAGAARVFDRMGAARTAQAHCELYLAVAQAEDSKHQGNERTT